MSRIRSIKPDWLEDELVSSAGLPARVLSIALILLADDYGRGRCVRSVLAVQAFPFDQNASGLLHEGLMKLSHIGFVRLYEVRKQHYFEICNWSKHQKVMHPGKPHVPAPLDDPPKSSGEPHENFIPDLDLQEGSTRGISETRAEEPSAEIRTVSARKPLDAPPANVQSEPRLITFIEKAAVHWGKLLDEKHREEHEGAGPTVEYDSFSEHGWWRKFQENCERVAEKLDLGAEIVGAQVIDEYFARQRTTFENAGIRWVNEDFQKLVNKSPVLLHLSTNTKAAAE